MYCIDAPQRIVTKSMYRTAHCSTLFNGILSTLGWHTKISRFLYFGKIFAPRTFIVVGNYANVTPGGLIKD
jgi:hypothetical protein